MTRAALSVAARALAGTVGAYAVTALATIVLSLALARLGVFRAEAVTAATLISYLIFVAIAVAAFHARSATRAWTWLAGSGLTLGFLWFALAPAT